MRGIQLADGAQRLRRPVRNELFLLTGVNRGILVYNICLISISILVSDGATNKSVLNIERSYTRINAANEYEADVLNTFSATQV